MASFNKFNAFVADIGLKVHNLNSDDLWVGLSNTAPTASNAVWTDITDISAGNGYSAGGASTSTRSYSQTSGTATLAAGNVVFTATGAVGPLRYAVIYNHTAASKNLIGWWDYGSSISLANTDTFTVNLSSNVLTIA